MLTEINRKYLEKVHIVNIKIGRLDVYKRQVLWGQFTIVVQYVQLLEMYS